MSKLPKFGQKDNFREIVETQDISKKKCLDAVEKLYSAYAKQDELVFKQLSVAIWLADYRLAVVLNPKGKTLHHMGKNIDNHIVLSSLEALYCSSRKSIQLHSPEGHPLSPSQCYEATVKEDNCFFLFLVYANLMRHGITVRFAIENPPLEVLQNTKEKFQYLLTKTPLPEEDLRATKRRNIEQPPLETIDLLVDPLSSVEVYLNRDMEQVDYLQCHVDGVATEIMVVSADKVIDKDVLGEWTLKVSSGNKLLIAIVDPPNVSYVSVASFNMDPKEAKKNWKK